MHRAALLLPALPALLAACGGGGGTTTTTSLALSDVSSLAATPASGMPTSGTASYAGSLALASTVTSSNTITGDFAMQVDFGTAAISASATNLSEAGANPGALTGSLSGSGSVSGTGFGTTLNGHLTGAAGAESLTTYITGSFKGSSAQGALGTAAGLWVNPANTLGTAVAGAVVAVKQ